MESDRTGPRRPSTLGREREPACERCRAACCVALVFDAGPGFSASKAAGERCLHLAEGDQCRIYPRRVELGYAGCVGYTCYGAGQHVTALRDAEGRGPQPIDGALFGSLVELHRLAWEVDRALALCPPEAEGTRSELRDLASGLGERLEETDPQRLIQPPGDLALRVAAALRAVGEAWAAASKSQRRVRLPVLAREDVGPWD